MDRRGKALKILLLAVLFLALVPYISFPSIEEAQTLIAKRLSVYVEMGYNFGTRYQQGFLEKGKSSYITVQLYKGNQYVFLAAGSKDASDVRIRLYDGMFSLVKEDNNNMNFSEIVMKATRSGTFHIKVTVEDSQGSGAHWCYITGYK